MESARQGMLLGSYFEWLVTEHNRALAAGDARLRTTVDPAQRNEVRASLRKAEQRFRQRLRAFPAAGLSIVMVATPSQTSSRTPSCSSRVDTAAPA